MEQLKIQLLEETFTSGNVLLRLTFKAMKTWDKCALFAVESRTLAMSRISSWGQSALFEKSDCFECLSSHNPAA